MREMCLCIVFVFSCSCVLRVLRVLACVRPLPPSIREDRAPLEAYPAPYGIRAKVATDLTLFPPQIHQIFL